MEKQVYRTRNHEIWMDHEGILWVRALEIDELELGEMKEIFKAYNCLCTKGKKVMQVIDARKGVTLTNEARDYGAKHGPEFFIASAVISDSLALRIIVNFSKAFYKSLVPMKMVSNEESAREWLRSQAS